MAVLKAQATFETQGFGQLLKLFPDANSEFLRFVGAEARHLLKEKYLSGQEINLMDRARDSKGRYLISSSINKRRTRTTISSYPVHLFERGRRLRGGGREPGKYIITKKLKGDIDAKIGGFAKRYEAEIMEKYIRKADLK